jgi:hypothetical protein
MYLLNGDWFLCLVSKGRPKFLIQRVIKQANTVYSSNVLVRVIGTYSKSKAIAVQVHLSLYLNVQYYLYKYNSRETTGVISVSHNCWLLYFTHDFKARALGFMSAKCRGTVFLVMSTVQYSTCKNKKLYTRTVNCKPQKPTCTILISLTLILHTRNRQLAF